MFWNNRCQPTVSFQFVVSNHNYLLNFCSSLGSNYTLTRWKDMYQLFASVEGVYYKIKLNNFSSETCASPFAMRGRDTPLYCPRECLSMYFIYNIKNSKIEMNSKLYKTVTGTIYILQPRGGDSWTPAFHMQWSGSAAKNWRHIKLPTSPGSHKWGDGAWFIYWTSKCQSWCKVCLWLS